MSMYAEYLKEHRGDELIENDKGFVVYRFLAGDGPTIYIVDIYVKPEFRRNKVASQLADKAVKIGQQVGCKSLLGTVESGAKNAHESLLVLLAYGMKLSNVVGSLIVFRKEI